MKFLTSVISLLLLCTISETSISDELSKDVSVVVREGIKIRASLNQVLESVRNIDKKDYDVDSVKDVHFFLYTRSNSRTEELFINDTKSVRQSSYKSTIPTKLVTHGWQNSYKDLSVQLVKNGFLSFGDYNVIAVDWGTYAKLGYLNAATKVLGVSKHIVEMVKILISVMDTDPKQITLVGHSLGAQVVGLAGLQLNETNNTVGHIVGLDPAGPGYETVDNYMRISTLDATFVEIIHTNPGRLGTDRSVGHVDYYVNGDDGLQPGCEPDFDYACSHGRAYRYYAEALTRPDAWYAIQCSRLNRLAQGYCANHAITRFPLAEANTSKPHGDYILVTNSQSLFGKGMDGITPKAAIQLHQEQLPRYTLQQSIMG